MKYAVMVNSGRSWELHGRRDYTKKQADVIAAKLRLESGIQAHSILVEKGPVVRLTTRVGKKNGRSSSSDRKAENG